VQALDIYARPIRGQTRLDSFTPVMFAAQAGHIEAVLTLLERGAKVNDVAADGTSTLVLAIANAHYELASVLLDKGADPNLVGQGWNALVQVVRAKNPSIGQSPPLVPTGLVSPVELAKKIIARGVEVDAPITQQIRDRFRTHMDMVGATAYLMAAKAADAEMMRVLLAAGANPRAKTKAGRTALMLAAGIDMWYVNEDSGRNEDAVEAIKVALDAGSDVNTINTDGDTALHGAAFRGSNEIVQMLVDRGAQLDIKNKLGFTPLMVANGDQRISCNLQRRPWTVELLTKLMTDRGLPVLLRTDEEKFADGVSTGYAADPRPPKC
jgi:ankyrin repeat protein